MSPADLPPPPVPAEHRSAQTVAADPLTAQQSHLAQIGWTPSSRGRRPLVAVLDTGVDASAPDLAGVVLTGAGRSFLPGRRDPGSDPDGHGTHVAGIIAARTGNGLGGSGVANARILPVTIADARGRTTTSALVRGIRYASARGARVINISFGGRGFSRAEQEAIDVATRRGALVVAAAGNSGGRGGGPDYPGAYRHVLAVAALGANGRAMPLSERGDQVAVAAPGEDVASTSAGTGDAGALSVRSGTSMASAVVAGAAARIIARRPRLTAQQVRAIIESTARDVPPSGADSATGAGALDLAAALAARPPAPGDPEPNDEISLAARTRPLLGPSGRDSNGRRGRTGSWSDPRDHHRVLLRAGQSVTARLRATGGAGADLDLLLWRPGAPSGARSGSLARRWLVGASLGPRASEAIRAVAPVTGTYSLEVRGVGGRESRGGRSVEYVLTVARDDPVTSAGYDGEATASRMGGT